MERTGQARTGTVWTGMEVTGRDGKGAGRRGEAWRGEDGIEAEQDRLGKERFFMDTISFQITGISPLLMNNAASLARNREGLAQKKIPTPEAEAESKVFREESTKQLYIPSEGFRFGIIKRGATGRRIGKRSASSVVSGALFLTHDRCPLTNGSDTPITDYEIDLRRAVVQRQGIIRARPRIAQWSCQVHYEFDEDFLSADIITELQIIAGKISGIGDFRPDKMGPMGRYTVEMIGQK